MKKNIYTISSTLPPAELKERLKWEAAIQNRVYKGQLKTVWRWKNEYGFTVCLVVSETNSGSGGDLGIGQRSVSWNFSAGASRTTFLSPIFCGKIFPDGSGSVIQGHFRERLFVWLMLIGIYGIGVVSLAVTKSILALVILLCLLVKGVRDFRSLLHPERIETSAALWDVLEYIVEKAERPLTTS